MPHSNTCLEHGCQEPAVMVHFIGWYVNPFSPFPLPMDMWLGEIPDKYFLLAFRPCRGYPKGYCRTHGTRRHQKHRKEELARRKPSKWLFDYLK